MKLNAIFSDGMILQAGKPVRVFGSGGGHLHIEFCGQVIDQDIECSRWTVTFPAMPYGGPYEMHCDLAGRAKTVSGILFGDVYLLSGQSNIELKLNEADYSEADLEDIPRMRLFTLEKPGGGEHFFPEDGWIACTKRNAPLWPCIGYQTGRILARRKDHAIGFIACYQGAAAIQAFLPEDVFEDASLTVPEELRFDMFYSWNTGHSALYRDMFCRIVPFSMAGVIWYQGESNNSEPESRLYARYLEALIRTWRRDLQDAQLRFVIVQIADYIPRNGEPWRRIQRAQLEAGQQPNADTVISSDVCENDLIHPRHKAALSARIADVLSN